MSECIVNLLPLTQEEKREFEAIAPDAVHIYAGRRSVTEEQLAQATILLGWVRAADLKKAGKLKWFQTMWAGTDEYEGPGTLPEGVILTSSSGSNSRSVAEHMLASVLALCRRLPEYRDSQREHRWQDEGKMRTLLDSTVLVLGVGHVGAAVGAMSRGLGSHTIGVKRHVSGPVEGFDQVCPLEELDSLLPRADVVALTLPHTPQTVGLMDARRIDLMKEDAILISAGRGSVLDQEALARAMQGGKLWGAALDVTVPEPLPADSPRGDNPRQLLTPPGGGAPR